MTVSSLFGQDISFLDSLNAMKRTTPWLTDRIRLISSFQVDLGL